MSLIFGALFCGWSSFVFFVHMLCRAIGALNQLGCWSVNRLAVGSSQSFRQPHWATSSWIAMTFQAAGYITDVPYAWHFAEELAPAWLDPVAAVSGFAPPARERGFAWCDLGCGRGLTATILPATHPAGRFCGIDFNAVHIESARHFATECRVENVEFYHADFSTAVESVSGGFDYIVSHGVYSWVDQQSQNALLRFIDCHLNPGGLAYISYYAMPGRAADLPFQRLVRALGLTLSGDSAKRCADAIDIVNSLTELKAPSLVGSPMAMGLKERPGELNPSYLSHEYMSENWNPLCVTDVRAAMRSIGLHPAGSARFMENFDSFVLGQGARATLAAIVDTDARELARDFLINQSFRRDVFVRHGRELDEGERRSRLLSVSFALTCPANMVEYARETPAGQLRYDNAVARAIVGALADGPRQLTGIGSEFALAPEDVLANALVLSAAGTICPVERSHTSVEDLNKVIGRRLGGPDEIRFLALSCGTALPINNELLSLLNGYETTTEGHCGEWRDFLSAYGVRLR
jgi:SAM-dependent methyltransferase